MKKEHVDIIADICIIVLTAALAFSFLFKSIFSILFPFLVAYIVARLIHRPSVYLSGKTHIPIGVISSIMVISFILIVCLLIWVGLNKLLSAAGEMLARFANEGSGISDAFTSLLDRMKNITASIPALESLRNNESMSSVCIKIDEFVHSSVSEFLEGIKNDVGSFISSVIKALPETFLYIIVTIISSIYMCSHFDSVNQLAIRLIPKKYREKVKKIKDNTVSALKSYFKAYSVIYLITFAELWFGFALMRRRSGFILALIIATVDILPVFGVGAILIPWAIAELTLGNGNMFLYLILLYIVITVVREFIEPKIIGKSIGLNPLITLFAIFSGYKLFGVFGMILLPIAAAALIGGNKSKIKENQ